MRDLGAATALSGGAIGPPGRRVFYLQVDHDGGRRAWFLLEKLQLANLAERMLEVVRDVEPADRVVPPPLADPDDVEFRVGEIAVALGEGFFRIELHPAEGDNGEAVAFEVDPAVLAGMSLRALEVVSAGRPLCKFCNLPMDPEGHVCPATNGHRGSRLGT